MHVLLDHMLIARIRLTYGHMRALDVRRTIHTYIYIYIYRKNSAVELTSVGLAHAHPNYS